MRGQKTSLDQSPCPIARSLDVIGDWWSLLILRDAFAGKSRYNEFLSSLGLAKNILSMRLKKLVAQGIFRIEADESNPRSHRYLLTEKAEGLGVVLVALWQWGEKTCFQPDELDRTIVEKATGVPLSQLTLFSRDGRQVGPRDYCSKERT